MANLSTFTPDRVVGTLTVYELEQLIANTVRRVLQETAPEEQAHTANALPETFMATFGGWIDPRSPEVIVAEIYESRTVSMREVDL